MNPSQLFASYAFAFEKAHLSDDWTAVEAFFAEDAVYLVADSPLFEGRWQGPKAITQHLKESLDQFDRRCDQRSIELVSMEETEGGITIQYKALYKLGEAELSFLGSEAAHYQGDKIVLLEDHFPPDSVKAIEAFAIEHKLV
ncbi:MAG: hypothetical protein P1V97_19500 [Planctomycetota bacterium]|nr:hypothetical protein [Planctomycetota bacterium]